MLDERDREGSLVGILPRKNELIRPAVANVDQALVVFAAARPDPHLNLLDRFLVMMERKGIPAILCFNKTDIAGDPRSGSWRRPTGTADAGSCSPARRSRKTSGSFSGCCREDDHGGRPLRRGEVIAHQSPAGGRLYGDGGHQREDRAGKAHDPARGTDRHRRGVLHHGYAGVQLPLYQRF